MKSIAPNCLKKVISLLNDGLSTRRTAKNCSISQSTVQRIRKRYCKSILLNGGGPKELLPQNERRITQFVTSGEASSAIIAAKLLKEDTNIQISQWTARRTLKGAEVTSVKKEKKPMLSNKNIKRRLVLIKNIETGQLLTGNGLFGQTRQKLTEFVQMACLGAGFVKVKGLNHDI
ncbi:hypothetical protein ANTQUA_LOCUS9995 [Anthophora quadrimaculata]